jgi:hypothetical protein
MKIVIYNEDDKKIKHVTQIPGTPVVEGNTVTWIGGRVVIGSPFLLVPDDIDLSEGIITDDVLRNDQKNDFVKKDEVKDRLTAVEMAVISLMDFT